MPFHLTVAGSLEPLADRLAEVLAEPLADPFAPEVVVVPADGVRRWLTSRLAAQLGATGAGAPDGVVANVEFLFPATLVRRALGGDCGLGAWSVGPLTWAVHEALLAEPDHFGQVPDAVRARAIADLFDRYALHRPQMVRAWGRGRDADGVGGELAEHHRWQPRLWRAVREQLGGTSDAERLVKLVAELRADGTVNGRPVADVLPERVFLFGLSGLPSPQLDVLAAVAAHVDVHALAPTVSPARWEDLRTSLGADDDGVRPLPRSDDRHASSIGHPLVTGWGRASREAHLLLLDAVASARAAGTEVSVDAPGEPAGLPPEPTLLERLQHDLLHDRVPPGPPAAGQDDRRDVLEPGDRSVEWHRCYGPGRQVEALRDTLLHLLQEQGLDGRYLVEPRHVAILCPDVARFAPLVEATFAGDPEHGVPAIPVRVADRTLRQDAALLDATGALLELLDGRFRASQVLGFLARNPVRRRFGLDTAGLDRVTEWVQATNVRWGLGDDDQREFGLPSDVRAHTWRAGLDQLLLGAAMGGDGLRLGPDDVVPFGAMEGDDVEVAGRLAEYVTVLDAAVERLRAKSTVHDWTAAVADAVRSLCDLPDDDAWQWHVLERTLDTFAAEATLDGEPRTTEADPFDLALLLQARLAGGGARARFGTGAVTLSALSAQRAVPHKVVCILGLDADSGAGAMVAAEDLTADPPCVGDRDPRSEQRAQLLDAVLAAGERLIIVTNGHDVRTNAPLPPVVPLAELLDVVDDTVVVEGSERARTRLAVDHPRQAWSPRNFTGWKVLGGEPWSFDTAALAAAGKAAEPERARRGGYLDEPLPQPDPPEPLTVHDLVDVCANPAKFFLRRRLGVWLEKPDEGRDDHIPLVLEPLDRWAVADALLRQRRAVGDAWSDADYETWAEAMKSKGAVPPKAFADGALEWARTLVDGIFEALGHLVPGSLSDAVPVAVDLRVDTPEGPVPVTGRVADVVIDEAGGHGYVVRTTASSLKDCDPLMAWITVAVLTAQDPSRRWRAVTVGRDGAGADWFTLELDDPASAATVLEVALDLHRRCWCDAVPAFAATTRAVHAHGLSGGRKAFQSSGPGRGDASDPFIVELFGDDFEALHALERRSDEEGPGCADSPGRLAYWAERLWGTLHATASLLTAADLAPARGKGDR